MLQIQSFCFNPFNQNTYVLYEENNLAVIIDPGNSNAQENLILENFILEKKLKIQRLLLTHAHIDHILGNKFIFDKYGLLPEMHKDDLFFLDRMIETANIYGISCDTSPLPQSFITEGEVIYLGNHSLQCFYTPGHSPGSISFYNAAYKILISGDVLFQNSIGRSDLPFGSHETLLKSIHEKLLILDDTTIVYSGHGSSTTIGHERNNNPFLIL